MCAGRFVPSVSLFLQVVSSPYSQKQRKGLFFFLDCAPQMSQPNPDAVVFVCCSVLPQLLAGNCLVSAIEHQFQREDCGFISYGRMTRKYVLCEHSRSLFFLVYTQSMKHVNIVVYAHLSVIH